MPQGLPSLTDAEFTLWLLLRLEHCSKPSRMQKQPAADVDVIRLSKLSATLSWAAAHFPSHLHKLQPMLKAGRKNKLSPVFGNTRTHNESGV